MVGNDYIQIEKVKDKKDGKATTANTNRMPTEQEARRLQREAEERAQKVRRTEKERRERMEAERDEDMRSQEDIFWEEDGMAGMEYPDEWGEGPMRRGDGGTETYGRSRESSFGSVRSSPMQPVPKWRGTPSRSRSVSLGRGEGRRGGGGRDTPTPGGERDQSRGPAGEREEEERRAEEVRKNLRNEEKTTAAAAGVATAAAEASAIGQEGVQNSNAVREQMQNLANTLIEERMNEMKKWREEMEEKERVRDLKAIEREERERQRDEREAKREAEARKEQELELKEKKKRKKEMDIVTVGMGELKDGIRMLMTAANLNPAAANLDRTDKQRLQEAERGRKSRNLGRGRSGATTRRETKEGKSIRTKRKRREGKTARGQGVDQGHRRLYPKTRVRARSVLLGWPKTRNQTYDARKGGRRARS